MDKYPGKSIIEIRDLEEKRRYKSKNPKHIVNGERKEKYDSDIDDREITGGDKHNSNEL